MASQSKPQQETTSDAARRIATEHVNDPKTAAKTEQAAAQSGLTGR